MVSTVDEMVQKYILTELIVVWSLLLSSKTELDEEI
jgi:hypothetical protein